MAKAKKNEAVEAIEDDFNLDAEPQESKATVITQADLNAAYAQSKSPEQAQAAIDLYDRYREIAGKFKPGQQAKYNDLKRFLKGR